MRKVSYAALRQTGIRIVGALCGLTLLLPGPAAGAATLWYNGNYDLNDAATNESNVPVNVAGSYVLEKSLVYDDFFVPVGQVWTLSSIFSNDQVSYYTAPTKATWEIRSGMSAGNGGALVASGDSTSTESLETAHDGNNYIDPEYRITEAVTVTLSAGTYWLAIAPDSNGYYGDQSYIETTSGAASVGLPTGIDGDSFINNNLTGPGASSFAASSLDFSAGVVGTVTAVPEPAIAPLALVGIAMFAGLHRSRRTPVVSSELFIEDRK